MNKTLNTYCQRTSLSGLTPFLLFESHICKKQSVSLPPSVYNSLEVWMCLCVGVLVSEQSLTALDGC